MKKETKRSGRGRKRSKRTFLDLLNDLADSMSAGSAANFRHLAGGSVLGRGRGWISGAISIARYLGCWKHHSTLYRFFSRARWIPDAISRRVFDFALRWADEVVEVAVDDTLCKRTGPHVWGAGVHIDPLATIYGNDVRSVGKKAFAFGHSWVVLSMRVRSPWSESPGFAVPIMFRLYRAKKSCPKEEYAKRTALAEEMIATVRSWLASSRLLSVVGDHEYACKTVIRALPSNTSFTGPIPKDARFYGLAPSERTGRPGRPRKRGARLASPAEIARNTRAKWRRVKVAIYSKAVQLEVYEQRGLWYSVDKERKCRMIVTRDPRGRYGLRALVTTDLNSSAATIIERYSRRWLIEVMFRQAKQHLGLGRAQNGWEKGVGSRIDRRKERERTRQRHHKGRAAVERTVPFVFIVQAAVIIHGLSAGRNGLADVARVLRPWAANRHHRSFEDLLTHARSELAHVAIYSDPPQRRVPRNPHPPFAVALLAA